MESIMEQIRTRLQNGETPQDLIKEGFKKTTVYAINRRLKEKTEESNDVKSMEQLMSLVIFLAFIEKEAMGQILSTIGRNHDYADESWIWKSIISIASDNFEKSLGKKPPKDFLNPTLKQPE